MTPAGLDLRGPRQPHLRRLEIDPTAVSSIEQIRAVPAADAALDEYLAEFGCRLVSSYDIDGLTLNEVPGAVCALIRRAGQQLDDPAETGDHVRAEVAVTEAELRSQCPDPAAFDDLLAMAREAYGVRDDNGPMTWDCRGR